MQQPCVQKTLRAKNLRIDFVITELFVGGAERCLTELAVGCARQGDRVRVASIGNFPAGTKARLVDRLKRHDIDIYSAQCDSPWKALVARARLRDWMKSDPADVVQTMLYHGNVIGTFAASAAGVPVRVGGVRVAERSWVRSQAEARAMRRMTAAVCVSESVMRFVRRSRRTDLPMHVIGNSIDLSHVDSLAVVDWSSISSEFLADDPQVLLFVGRLHRQKGLDVLFDALPPLLERFPEMRVVIAGDGPLHDFVQQNGVDAHPGRLVMTGWRSDALSLIKGCRVLVLPSRFEGMPNVVMEAMAARKPVAATRVEGIGELLREGAIDQSCPREDAAALKLVIEKLWSDPGRGDLIGERNREIVAAHHSTEAMVQSYRDLYFSLI